MEFIFWYQQQCNAGCLMLNVEIWTETDFKIFWVDSKLDPKGHSRVHFLPLVLQTRKQANAVDTYFGKFSFKIDCVPNSHLKISKEP